MHPQPSRRQRVAPLIELRIQIWWEMLVTLQFVTSSFVSRHPIYSRATGSSPSKIGSGGGSCAHGDRAYEARLNLILPAVKWWSRRVSHPHQPACRAGALLVCHDPGKMAGRLGAAPSELSFGDSVAQAGARPMEDWCGCREWASQALRDGCPKLRCSLSRTVMRPDFLRGGEVFWLLNHNRGN